MCLQDTARIIPRDVVHGLLTELTARQKLRLKWDERRADKIYQRRIATEFRPVARPIFPGSASTSRDDAVSQPQQQQQRLPKDLSSAIRDLSRILNKYGSSKEEGTTPTTTTTITIGTHTPPIRKTATSSTKNGTKQPRPRPNVISKVVEEDDNDHEPPNKKPRQYLVTPAKNPTGIEMTAKSHVSVHPPGKNNTVIKNESQTARKKRKKFKKKKVPFTKAE
jgi:hypothetical protein